MHQHSVAIEAIRRPLCGVPQYAVSRLSKSGRQTPPALIVAWALVAVWTPWTWLSGLPPNTFRAYS